MHEIQKIFFNQVNAKIPPNFSLVNEVAELLGISDDSAYRRIRGEKELTIDEIYKLCRHYSISFDSLMNIESNQVVFESVTVDPVNVRIKNWLDIILEEMKIIAASKEKEVIFAAIDLPLFHFSQVPELMAFKIFFWEKTLYQFPDYEDKKFKLDDIDSEVAKQTKQLVNTWITIPTIEIWNEDNFNIMLRQLEFYWHSGFFHKKDDLKYLCEKLLVLLNHIKKQAEHGIKFGLGQEQEGIENSFRLYENEVVLNDNTIFVKTEKTSKVFLTYNVLSLLSTQNPLFCSYTENCLKRLISKSSLISKSGDKERNIFFNRITQTINSFIGRMD